MGRIEKPLLEVNALKFKSSGKRKLNLPEVTSPFQICAGDVCCIVGKSGEGKSTLLLYLAGVLDVVRTEVKVSHAEVYPRKEAERRDLLALVFQHNNLYPFLTLADNLLKGAKGVERKTLKGYVEADPFLKPLLEPIDNLHIMPSEISGGQMQRAALAKAILKKRPLLMLDEALNSLDIEAREGTIAALIGWVRADRNRAIIAVSHDPDFIGCANKFLYLRDGAVHTAQGDTPQQAWEELLRQPTSEMSFFKALTRGHIGKEWSK